MGTVSIVPAQRVNELCPDCPVYFPEDNDEVKKTLTLSLEKFNKESGLNKHFALLKFHRALVSVSFQFLLCSYCRCSNPRCTIQAKLIHFFRFSLTQESYLSGCIFFPQASHQTLLINHVRNVWSFQAFVHLWTKVDDIIHVFLSVYLDGHYHSVQCRIHHPGDHLP